MHLLTCVREASDPCEVCRAFDQAPHAPMAGTSVVAMINGNLQADLLSLDAIIALHSMGVFLEVFLVVRVRTKNPLQGWGAFFNSRIGVFVPPR